MKGSFRSVLLFLALAVPSVATAQDPSPKPAAVAKVWADFYALCREAERRGGPEDVPAFRDRAARQNGFTDWETFVAVSKEALPSEEWVRIQDEAHRAYKDGTGPSSLEVRLRVRVKAPPPGEEAKWKGIDLVSSVASVARRRLELAKARDVKVEAEGRDGLTVRFRIGSPYELEDLKRLVVERGELLFRRVADDDLAERFRGKAAPPGHAWAPYADGDALREPELIVLDDGFNLGGEILETVHPTLDVIGFPALGFRIRPGFQEIFSQMTHGMSEEMLGAGKGGKLAILLDGKVLSAPMVKSRIHNDGIITGGSEGFKLAERDRLVAVLNSGRYPVGVVLESERVERVEKAEGK